MRKFPGFMVLAFLASGGISAAVHEDLQYYPYRVAVDGNESLLQALNRATPIRHNNQLFHAHTHYNVSWQAQWDKVRDNHCAVKDVEVDLITLVQLPRLAQASADQHKVFDRYRERLITHELGHHDIGRQAAFAVERFLLSGPNATTCADLQNKINNKVADIIQQHAQKDKAYDQKTRHGKTQGAYLQDRD